MGIGEYATTAKRQNIVSGLKKTETGPGTDCHNDMAGRDIRVGRDKRVGQNNRVERDGDFQGMAHPYSSHSFSNPDYANHGADASPVDICPSILFFNHYGIGLPILKKATLSAKLSGRLAGEEIVRSGVVSHSSHAMICADNFGLEFSAMGPAPDRLTGHVGRMREWQAFKSDKLFSHDFYGVATEYRGWEEKPRIFIAGEPHAQKAIGRLISHRDISKQQVVLTTRKALVRSQFLANCKFYLAMAINGLAQSAPAFSARMVISRMQIMVLLMIVAMSIGIWTVLPAYIVIALHFAASAFYLAVTLMRAMMIIPGAGLVDEAVQPGDLSSREANDLPIYTVMVALYKESGQVDELAASLNAINWPHDRLQVLFICESDDSETIARCQAHEHNEIFQTVICPAAEPRTKPKALNYALPLASGEYLVLYDAEDRPHREQLREAYAKFNGVEDFACLQAPLVIHNDRQSWFTRMFAIEYTTQFNLILPVLEKWRSPIPLGGTSNHFQTSLLRNSGAWDPYNVTEDADLGIRMARLGYRCGTIKLPTYEEAPPVFDVWFKQRTRWIKGWLQTFLVHMRNPAKLSRDLGARNAMFFHLVISAIVISVLIHPFFIASSIYYAILLAQQPHPGNLAIWMLGIDVFNLVGGYSTYFAICWLSLVAKNKHYLLRSIVWLPVYWLLISLAGWRAVFQLIVNPHGWEKTKHGFSHHFISSKNTK